MKRYISGILFLSLLCFCQIGFSQTEITEVRPHLINEDDLANELFIEMWNRAENFDYEGWSEKVYEIREIAAHSGVANPKLPPSYESKQARDYLNNLVASMVQEITIESQSYGCKGYDTCIETIENIVMCRRLSHTPTQCYIGKRVRYSWVDDR